MANVYGVSRYRITEQQYPNSRQAPAPIVAVFQARDHRSSGTIGKPVSCLAVSHARTMASPCRVCRRRRPEAFVGWRQDLDLPAAADIQPGGNRIAGNRRAPAGVSASIHGADGNALPHAQIPDPAKANAVGPAEAVDHAESLAADDQSRQPLGQIDEPCATRANQGP